MPKQAVLLLAHGTPETIDQIPEYLRNVVSGRPLSEAVIEEIKHRYSLIGHSPLTEITLEQGKMVEAELTRDGLDVQVYVGMRNWKPYIPDVVRKMRADGAEGAAVICLAPQNSRTSVGLYKRAVQAEAGSLKIDFAEGWARELLLAEAFAERLRVAEARLSSEIGAPVPVLFTAHSVPTRTVQSSETQSGGPRMWPGEGADPYADDARATAELVAARLPEIPKWVVCLSEPGSQRRSLDRSQRRGNAYVNRRRGRENPPSSADRVSLRSRRNPLRYRHRLQGVRKGPWHPAGAAGVTECIPAPGAGDRGTCKVWPWSVTKKVTPQSPD